MAGPLLPVINLTRLARRKNKEFEAAKSELHSLTEQETRESQKLKELKKALYGSQQKLDELKKLKAQKVIEQNTANNVITLAEAFVAKRKKK